MAERHQPQFEPGIGQECFDCQTMQWLDTVQILDITFGKLKKQEMLKGKDLHQPMLHLIQHTHGHEQELEHEDWDSELASGLRIRPR